MPPIYASQPPPLDECTSMPARVAALENELWHARAEAHTAREANRFILESISRQPWSGTAQSLVQPSELAQLQARLRAVEHDRDIMKAEIEQLSTKLLRTGGQYDPIMEACTRQARPREPLGAGRMPESSKTVPPAYSGSQLQHEDLSSAQPNIYKSLTSGKSADFLDLFAKPMDGHRSDAQFVQQHPVRSNLQQVLPHGPQQRLPFANQGYQGRPRGPNAIQHWKTYAQQEPARHPLEPGRRYQDWDAEVNTRDTKRAKDLDYGDEKVLPKEEPTVTTVIPVAQPDSEVDVAKLVTPARKLVYSNPKTLGALEGRDEPTDDTAEVTDSIDWEPLVPSPPVASEAPTSGTSATTSKSAKGDDCSISTGVTQVKAAVAGNGLTASQHEKPSVKHVQDPFGRSLRSYADLDDDDNAVSEAATSVPHVPLFHDMEREMHRQLEGVPNSATAKGKETSKTDSAKKTNSPGLATAGSPSADVRSNASSGQVKPAPGRTLRSYADLDDSGSEPETNTERKSSSHAYGQSSGSSDSDYGHSTGDDQDGSDYDSHDDRDVGNDISARLNYDDDEESADTTSQQAPRKILKPTSRTKSQPARITEYPTITADHTSATGKGFRCTSPAAIDTSPAPATVEGSQKTSVDEITAKLSATSFGEGNKLAPTKPREYGSDLEEDEVDESEEEQDRVSQETSHQPTADTEKGNPARDIQEFDGAGSVGIKVMERMASLRKGQPSVELDY